MRVGLLGAVAVLGMLVAAACGDSDLNYLGAPGAHEVTYDLELGDFYIRARDAGPAAAEVDGRVELLVPAHTDLTLRLHNAGAVPHSLTLYASAEPVDEMARSLMVEPGESTVISIHFHDPQVALFRDDAYPERMQGLVRVEE